MAKYTLLLNGSIQINETGQVCPSQRGNYISDAIVSELLKAGCASQDSTGLVAFSPDGTLLDAEVPYVETLDEAKVKAYTLIDNEAGRVRSKYITVAPGQEATYISKGDQAQKYASAGYDVTTISNYVWLVAECRSLGLAVDTTADSAAIKSVVDGILAEQNAWYQIGARIEEIRRTAKIKIGAETGTTAAKVKTAKTNIQNHINEALTQFGAM